ncbi:Calcineurin-like phosphoesterase [Roseovarius nanhaiticus]|uniref:Calcineurin-like phosphoesterase n=1 Tax=Roseovarius nanhaiticus TaxID=573024 RepID=A0A1N7HDA6_9RHOB|nr:phosphodiesterase [Roseovarius nanhaiticus]SEL01268.1 Calcineurin-like phosphoesterase [Roseovarius nanhaiticus]SIS22869.1 Calcineurin-like phosphoesterase [Roseovarius nanhaiticus]
MRKTLIFTDLHYTAPGGRIGHLDPDARFRAGLAHALAQFPDAERIVVTGDLTHHGRPEEYAHLRTALADCPLPVHLTIGNHDRRAIFAAAFPDAPRTSEGHVCEVVDTQDARLILLDTVDDGQHAGVVCDVRLAWLDAALAGAEGRPVVLFLHHPPMLTGFDAMDEIGLTNRAALLAVLKRRANTCQIIAGHMHRTISGPAGGIPTTILKSPCHQSPILRPGMDSHSSIDEPGAYGILYLGPEGPIVHSEDFGVPERKALSYV